LILQAHADWVPSCVQWEQHGIVLSCSYDGTVRATPMDRGQGDGENGTNNIGQESWEVAHTDHHREGFIAMDLCPKRGMIVAGSDYGAVYALHAKEDTDRLELQRVEVPLFEAPDLGRAEMIQSIEVHDDVLFCGCEGGPIHARRMDDLTGDVTVLPGHTNSVMCMRGMHHMLASCAMDQSLRVWDTTTLQCTRHIPNAHDRSLHSLCLHNTEATMFTGSRDHAIKVWDLRSCQSVGQLDGHLGSVTCLALDDRRLLSGGGFNRGPGDVEVLSTDSTLRMWDLRMMKPLWHSCIRSVYLDNPMAHQFAVQDEPVLCVQLLRGRILSGHGDGSVRCSDFTEPHSAPSAPWKTRGFGG